MYDATFRGWKKWILALINFGHEVIQQTGEAALRLFNPINDNIVRLFQQLGWKTTIAERIAAALPAWSILDLVLFAIASGVVIVVVKQIIDLVP